MVRHTRTAGTFPSSWRAVEVALRAWPKRITTDDRVVYAACCGHHPAASVADAIHAAAAAGERWRPSASEVNRRVTRRDQQPTDAGEPPPFLVAWGLVRRAVRAERDDQRVLADLDARHPLVAAFAATVSVPTLRMLPVDGDYVTLIMRDLERQYRDLAERWREDADAIRRGVGHALGPRRAAGLRQLSAGALDALGNPEQDGEAARPARPLDKEDA